MSLARALSKFGVCSRAEAGRLIAEGRVDVNRRRAGDAHRFVDPVRDHIAVDGRRVGDLASPAVVALHKPQGFITTRSDPGGRPTIYRLLGSRLPWLFPVGRLDRDTAGLIIFTNDHRLGHRLTDPAFHVPRTYHVLVRGTPSREALRVLREGVLIGPDEATREARVTLLGSRRSGDSWIEMALTEGRNRQVRRMFAAVGHDVLKLVRVRIGALELGDLAPGEWRRLSPREVLLLTGGA